MLPKCGQRLVLSPFCHISYSNVHEFGGDCHSLGFKFVEDDKHLTISNWWKASYEIDWP